MVYHFKDAYKEPPLDHQRAVVDSLEFRSAVDEILPGFPPPDKAWQPSDRIPTVAELYNDRRDELEDRLKVANEVPDDIMVCFIGNEVTEAVLGNYTRELERTYPQTSENIDHPFHKFGRYWAAEEERHGTIMDRYLQFSSRINMRAIEEAIHRLGQAGFTTRGGESLYQGIIYPRIQEHLTALAHIGVGKKCQDPYLRQICADVTSDETRHKGAYNTLVKTLMKLDPEGTTIATGNLVRKGIVMPAALMNSPDDPGLYDRFTIMAAKQDVLGPRHMLQVHNGLMQAGKHGVGLAEKEYSGEYKDAAEEARTYLLDRYPRFIQKAADRFSKKEPVSLADFDWMRSYKDKDSSSRVVVP